MKKSEIISLVLYDYESLGDKLALFAQSKLTLKELRWMAYNHVDNRTRKLLLRLSNIEIGKSVVINRGFFVFDSYQKLLTIGDRVSIASDVTVVCESSPNNSRLKDIPFVQSNLIRKGSIKIQNDAWIGANVTILPGVTVSECAIVGAGSVVTQDVPPYMIVKGVPAKQARKVEGALDER